MFRVPEVEITRSLADPALRIIAFIDCAEMLAWEHETRIVGRRYVSRPVMVYAEVADDGKSVTWKFSFLDTSAAVAFDEGFGS